MCKYIGKHLEGYIPHCQMSLRASKGVGSGRDKDLQHRRVIIEFILFSRYLCTSSKYTLGFVQFGLSSTPACNILADVSEQARCPYGDPGFLERDAGVGGCKVKFLMKALCVCSYLCK